MIIYTVNYFLDFKFKFKVFKTFCYVLSVDEATLLKCF
jgi:hypothetical protein